MESSENSKKKPHTHRRPKNQIPNNFLCGCGKKYGSNAALYTHIKTKHPEGEPEGTARPQQNAAKGQKGRPRAIESPHTDVYDEVYESVMCKMCMRKDQCICPEKFDREIIKRLSEELFINYIKYIGNFGESKQADEGSNQWVRNVDEDIVQLSTQEVRQKFEQVCIQKKIGGQLNNKLAKYLSQSSKYWSSQSINELYRGIFAIICLKNSSEIESFINTDPTMKKFRKQFTQNKSQFQALVRLLQQINS